MSLKPMAQSQRLGFARWDGDEVEPFLTLQPPVKQGKLFYF
ncbi:MAG: hypothetical protein SOZ54_03495 [Candidatus Limiplasma sp.]|nr:hypothetical protein [Candidatus Limiplasma sp.]